MGKSLQSTFRVEYRDQKGWHTALWRGRATNFAAEKWRKAMNKSLEHGGANYHLSKACNMILHVSQVHVIQQKTGRIAATAAAPMFEIV